MFKLVALVLQRIERLVLYLPPGPSTSSNFQHVLLTDFQIGRPAKFGDFPFGIGDLQQHKPYPDVCRGIIQRQAVTPLQAPVAFINLLTIALSYCPCPDRCANRLSWLSGGLQLVIVLFRSVLLTSRFATQRQHLTMLRFGNHRRQRRMRVMHHCILAAAFLDLAVRAVHLRRRKKFNPSHRDQQMSVQNLISLQMPLLSHLPIDLIKQLMQRLGGNLVQHLTHRRVRRGPVEPKELLQIALFVPRPALIQSQ